MYGKHFAQMYEGSMMGIGAVPFAVWGYCISHVNKEGFVDLNPQLLAVLIGETVEDIEKAITTLQQPDPDSRCDAEEGRRLVEEGPFLYRLPSYPEYRDVWNEESRREYLRRKKRESRARQKPPGRPEGVDEDGVITDSEPAGAKSRVRIPDDDDLEF